MDQIRLLLDWKQDAKHAIFQAGLDGSEYQKRGIQLILREPEAKSIDALAAVSNGRVEMAINYPHNLMHQSGEGLLSVGALVKHNPQGLLSLERAGIETPTELAGKRIGIGPSPISKVQFDVFVSSNNLSGNPPETITVGFEGEDLLLENKIDALDAVAYANIRTIRKGFPVRFFPYIKSGVPDSPFLVFIADSSWCSRNERVVRSFFEATAAGYQRACRWEQEHWSDYVVNTPGRSIEEEYAVWKDIQPLIWGSGKLFQQNHDELQRLQEILYEANLIDRKLAIDRVFTNHFLP
jgi:putative hydroxymethylpyrimidine transport system substrate-binding protein